MEALLREGKVGPLTGFRNKMGRPFEAEIRLNDAKLPEFDFGQPREGEEVESVDFSGQEPLGKCPKCGAQVFEHGNAYVCERGVGAERSCDFRSGKTILQQPVEPAQMRKLLAEGKSELLTGFVSARNRRKFSAYLVRDKTGKVGFEFEPREPREPRAAKEGKPGGAQKKPDAAVSEAGRELGLHPIDNKPVYLKDGRFGPYVQHGALNVTLPEELKPEEVTLDDAVDLIAAKLANEGRSLVKAAGKPQNRGQKPPYKKPGGQKQAPRGKPK
jgi:hypothetical protein